jgi:hypothetical protein
MEIVAPPSSRLVPPFTTTAVAATATPQTSALLLLSVCVCQMSKFLPLFILVCHVTFPSGDDFSFWGFLFPYYYSSWANFSSRVIPHLFNGSLASRIFYSKYKGYTGG